MEGFITPKRFLLGLALIVCPLLKAQMAFENTLRDSLSPLIFPLDSDDFIRISSNFGYRTNPIDHTWKLHQGIDLVAKKGKPIYASAKGLVTKASYENGYGNHIILSHLEGFKTLYGHLWVYLVHQGEIISQGQLIGFVGESGRVTGPHLHYEIWYKDRKLDPLELWKYCMKGSYNSENI